MASVRSRGTSGLSTVSSSSGFGTVGKGRVVARSGAEFLAGTSQTSFPPLFPITAQSEMEIVDSAGFPLTVRHWEQERWALSIIWQPEQVSR